MRGATARKVAWPRILRASSWIPEGSDACRDSASQTPVRGATRHGRRLEPLRAQNRSARRTEITSRQQRMRGRRRHRGQRGRGSIARSTAELARITRVTSLGELAASITHEVLQPISAIISNGEAPLNFLLLPKPEIDEVCEGLESMVADAHPTGAVGAGARFLRPKEDPR